MFNKETIFAYIFYKVVSSLEVTKCFAFLVPLQPMLPFLCKTYEQSLTARPTPLPKLPLNTLHKNKNNKVSVFKLALCHSNFGSKHLITLFSIKHLQESSEFRKDPLISPESQPTMFKTEQIGQSMTLYNILRSFPAFMYEAYNTTRYSLLNPTVRLSFRFLGLAVIQTTLKPHGLFYTTCFDSSVVIMYHTNKLNIHTVC
jgi:hypothetical protein